MRKIELQKGQVIRDTQFTYLEEAGFRYIGNKKRRLVNARCSCGVEKIVVLETIGVKNTRSCGCYHDKIIRTHNLTKGVTQGGKADRIYKISAGIMQRCNNPKNTHYDWYGKRGIKCDFDSLYKLYLYLKTLPNYTPDKWIDRINNNGNYEFGNLRWVTPRESANNRREKYANK